MSTNKDQAEKIVAALRQQPALMAEVQTLLRNPPSGNYTEQHFIEVGLQLERFRTFHGMRLDWHEPDEQDVTARVIGTLLDNAMGNRVEQAAIDGGYQELVVEVNAGDGTNPNDPDNRIRVNLATLLAIAAAYGRKSQE